MSICTPCLVAKPIPSCTQTLNIGTISDINANVRVYIQDITTGQILSFDTTSDGSGLVSVDLSENNFFDNHAYEMWVTDANAEYRDAKDITIDSQTEKVICLRFEYVQDSTGGSELFTSQTLQNAN